MAEEISHKKYCRKTSLKLNCYFNAETWYVFKCAYFSAIQWAWLLFSKDSFYKKPVYYIIIPKYCFILPAAILK